MCVCKCVAIEFFELELVDFTTAHLYKCGLLDFAAARNI